ncbi:MAG: extracellular solute-binding protein, partial [Bacteroidetes bacterium]|nr:extracellular solute-binding protein [Bacteroidota bacterium]
MHKEKDPNLQSSRFGLNSNQRLYAIITSVLVVSFILLFYAFPGYEPNAKAKGPVVIAFADNISLAHQKVIDLFNKEHMGRIKVVPVNLPFSKFSTDDRKELLARYFRSKSDRIDVFSVDQIWVPRFARWCVPLDKYIPNDQIGLLTKYATQSCYLKGDLVAAPLYLDIALMFYRKDLLQK